MTPQVDPVGNDLRWSRQADASQQLQAGVGRRENAVQPVVDPHPVLPRHCRYDNRADRPQGFGNIVEQVPRHEMVCAHDRYAPFPGLFQASLANNEVVLQVDDIGLGPVENAVQLGVDIGPRRYPELGWSGLVGKDLIRCTVTPGLDGSSCSSSR